jgi:hypothetical protein
MLRIIAKTTNNNEHDPSANAATIAHAPLLISPPFVGRARVTQLFDW